MAIIEQKSTGGGKFPKTNKERCKEYRDKRKAMKEQEDTELRALQERNQELRVTEQVLAQQLQQLQILVSGLRK